MAIALRGTPTNATNGAGSSQSVNVPAGVVNGDLLLCHINGYKSGGTGVSVPNTPAGWNLILGESTGGDKSAGGGGAGNAALGAYYRVAASEPASYTFSNNGAGDAYIDVSIIALSGVDTTSPFNLTSLSTHGMGSSPASADLGSTTRDGCWHLLFASSYDGITSTPASYSSDSAWDGTPISNWIGHRVVTTAGATSAQSFATNFTDGTVIWALAIQPPAAVAGGSIGPINPGQTWRRQFWLGLSHPIPGTVPGGPQNLQQSLTGALSFTGTGPTKAIAKSVPAATLSFAGTSARATTKGFAAAVLSFSGTATRTAGKSLGGTLSFTGAGPARAASKGVAATLSFSGSQARAISKGLPGATLSFVGAVPLRAVTKGLTAATLSFGGATARAITKGAFAATLGFSGAMVSGKQFLRSLSGGLSFSASQSRQVGKGVSGTLSFAGSGPVRAITRGLVAGLSFSGSLPRAVTKGLAAATLSFAGAVVGSRLYQRVLSGSLSFTGAQSRQTTKVHAGSLLFTGSQSRAISKGLTANLSFAGGIGRAIRKGLAGTLGFLGGLVGAKGGVGGPASVQVFLSTAYPALVNISDAFPAQAFVATAYSTQTFITDISGGSVANYVGKALLIRNWSGTTASPTGGFRNTAGTLYDPPSPQLIFRPPNGPRTVVSGGSLTHDGTGLYSYVYTPTADGDLMATYTSGDGAYADPVTTSISPAL